MNYIIRVGSKDSGMKDIDLEYECYKDFDFSGATFIKNPRILKARTRKKAYGAFIHDMQKLVEHTSLHFWSIIPKNQVFSPNFLQVYDIAKILANNKILLSSQIYPTSKFIKIHLNLVMFDCLARDFSNGFFDDNDIPPAELWLDYKQDDYIIAFIPIEYEKIVDFCIQDTMSESIEWIIVNKLF